VVLVVESYDSLALRLAVSPETQLAAVHMHSYYPGVVLGVAPSKVTRDYLPQEGSQRTECQYSDGRDGNALQRLGLEPVAREVIRLQGAPPFRVGGDVPASLQPPLLGSFLDLQMPVPSQYGLAVLASRRYLRPHKSPPGTIDKDALEVLHPFRFPPSLYGAHSRVFVVRDGVRAPSGNPGHSKVIHLRQFRH